MGEIFKILKNNSSELFYSFAITVGMYISFSELVLQNNSYRFVVFAIISFFIYFSEIIFDYFNKSRRVEFNLNPNDGINEVSELINKIMLPVILYFSLLGFSYFNIESRTFLLILIIVFFIYFILIKNIRFFFRNKRKAEEHTHYVYDLIKLLVVFLISNFLSHLYQLGTESLVLLSLIFGVVIFLMGVLIRFNIEGKHYKERIVFASIYLPIFTVTFFALNYINTFNALKISLVVSIIFYVVTAFMYHVSNKNLTKTLIAEYFLVLIIVLSLSYGLT